MSGSPHNSRTDSPTSAPHLMQRFVLAHTPPRSPTVPRSDQEASSRGMTASPRSAGRQGIPLMPTNPLLPSSSSSQLTPNTPPAAAAALASTASASPGTKKRSIVTRVPEQHPFQRPSLSETHPIAIPTLHGSLHSPTTTTQSTARNSSASTTQPPRASVKRTSFFAFTRKAWRGLSLSSSAPDSDSNDSNSSIHSSSADVHSFTNPPSTSVLRVPSTRTGKESAGGTIRRNSISPAPHRSPALSATSSASPRTHHDPPHSAAAPSTTVVVASSAASASAAPQAAPVAPFVDPIKPNVIDHSMGRGANPFLTASYFSIVFLHLLNPVLTLGKKRSLQIDDIWDPTPQDQTDVVHAKLEAAWLDECRTWKEKEAKRLLALKLKGLPSSLPISSPSIYQALRRAFGWRVYWMFFLEVLYYCFYGTVPFSMRLLITYIYAGGPDSQPEYCFGTTYLSCGLVYSFSLSLAVLASSIAINHKFYHAYRVGGQMRSALMTCVYAKSLRLSAASRASSTTGEMINLMSNDCSRVFDAILFYNTLFIAPCVILFSLSLLIYEIGLAAVASVFLMLVIVPLQVWTARATSALRKKMLVFSDARIKFISEILAGIRVIKLYEWTQPISAKIDAMRDAELRHLFPALLLKALNLGVLFVYPVCVTFVTFVLYSRLGNEVIPSNVFIVMSFLTLIRFPVSLMPQAITFVSEARVGMQRIERFLMLEELQSLTSPASSTASADAASSSLPKGAIRVSNGEFRWSPDQLTPVLSDINLSIEPGELVGVIGTVGSGKSSLMTALLGEMEASSATQLSISGRVSFMHQKPWIRNHTVKSNILFGLPQDDELYGQCLDASALRADLAILPAGDLTEIGENGLNISGGQKQRISLARALYRRHLTDIFLLDDCFSAVDLHTGKHMFDCALRQVLAGKTRVVVLNSHLHFLERFDKIIVIDRVETAAPSSGSDAVATVAATVQPTSLQAASSAEFAASGATLLSASNSAFSSSSAVLVPPVEKAGGRIVAIGTFAEIQARYPELLKALEEEGEEKAKETLEEEAEEKQAVQSSDPELEALARRGGRRRGTTRARRMPEHSDSDNVDDGDEEEDNNGRRRIQIVRAESDECPTLDRQESFRDEFGGRIVGGTIARPFAAVAASRTSLATSSPLGAPTALPSSSSALPAILAPGHRSRLSKNSISLPPLVRPDRRSRSRGSSGSFKPMRTAAEMTHEGPVPEEESETDDHFNQTRVIRKTLNSSASSTSESHLQLPEIPQVNSRLSSESISSIVSTGSSPSASPSAEESPLASAVAVGALELGHASAGSLASFDLSAQTVESASDSSPSALVLANQNSLTQPLSASTSASTSTASSNSSVFTPSSPAPSPADSSPPPAVAVAAPAAPSGVLIAAETSAQGEISLRTYYDYFKIAGSSYGPIIFVLVLLSYTFGQIARILSDYWLVRWGADNNSPPPAHDSTYWIATWAAWIVTAFVFALSRAYIYSRINIESSRNLHNQMFVKLMHAPCNLYFDLTPAGRILNRFSRDLEQIDTLLPSFLHEFVLYSFQFLGTILLACVVTIYFLPIIFPIIIFFLWIQQFFRNTSRELKRLEGTTRSPIFSSFGETLTGLSTIRAYGMASTFITENERLVDLNSKVFLMGYLAERWLSIRLEICSFLVVFSVALLTSGIRDSINPTLAGLTLIYALQMTGLLQWTVRLSIQTENTMTAVERLMAFTQLPQEAPFYSHRVSPTWPQHGAISFMNAKLRYRPELDLVMKGITCNVEAGEKIGICGRTGSGKSTLMVALFRLVELSAGSIEIDGVDIASIGLAELRSKLSIIPQDSWIVSGTVRSNLDPFNLNDDETLWQALERVGLSPAIRALEGGLDGAVSESGDNFSHGQKQLVCIARALLRKTKILIMDEASASIDPASDRALQETIAKNFVDNTILTIAHRLDTIITYDRVMVLRDGLIAEYDRPSALLRRTDSLFYGMVSEGGEALLNQFLALADAADIARAAKNKVVSSLAFDLISNSSQRPKGGLSSQDSQPSELDVTMTSTSVSPLTSDQRTAGGRGAWLTSHSSEEV